MPGETTRNKVMAMSDSELNLRAAEICRIQYEYLVPKYATNIIAVWDLIDYILNHKNGWAFTLETSRDGAGYRATFENLEGKKFTAIDNGLDPTPERAITRAFILAMEGER